jgi:signal transduction histidine kinase
LFNQIDFVYGIFREFYLSKLIIISVIFQLAAAVLSIRLMKSMGKSEPLVFITSGLFIIALTHSVLLVMWYLNKDPSCPRSMEFLGLMASIMFFGMVFSFLFLIKSIRTKDQIQKEALAEKLQAKNRELNELISSVSHDLKTPMVNIKGFIGEIESYCRQFYEAIPVSNDSPAAERLFNYDLPEAISFISASTQKIDKIIIGLTDLSEIGTVQFKIDCLDMNRIVNNVLMSMEFQFRRADIKVRVDENLPACYGDSSAVGRVFMNLLSNAAKYMSPHRKAEITITGVCVDGHTEYHVVDNGIGIAHEHKDEIFKPFRRLNIIETDGEGLGLNIVQTILDRLNGGIKVESAQGQGSRFIVSLPSGDKN